MDLTLLSLSIKVFEFEFSLSFLSLFSLCVSVSVCLSVCLSLSLPDVGRAQLMELINFLSSTPTCGTCIQFVFTLRHTHVEQTFSLFLAVSGIACLQMLFVYAPLCV